MKLQADPTVKFATGRFDLRRITSEHLSVRSAYNITGRGYPPDLSAYPELAQWIVCYTHTRAMTCICVPRKTSLAITTLQDYLHSSPSQCTKVSSRTQLKGYQMSSANISMERAHFTPCWSRQCRDSKSTHILIVGLGGVGGWAAEMLARAGVGEMTLSMPTW